MSKNWEEVWEIKGISEKELNQAFRRTGVNVVDNTVLCRKEPDGLWVKIAIRRKEKESVKMKMRWVLKEIGFHKI